MEQEEILKHCLAGHSDVIWRFGSDNTKCDGLNQYCYKHARERSQAQRDEKKAEDAQLRSVSLSEQAIKRHEARRKQEAEIEAKLKEKEQEAESFRFETKKTFRPRWRVA